ncbi:cell surface GPI-anchored protein ECM33 [[Candida] jaroonii]|uniref:Cell surface GPI-anchored protein ECM33 n=1 Tax=[Candida] jaroonii TaxID=467808 RepID=A0ACA9Y9T3_9ASCO|nr:cell surface GPI-anchored protein ECM33 [[Candida] jaroonii]
MYWKSLYPLALALAVKAESSASCSFDDATMTAAASISQLASCPTLEGTLEISGDGIGSLDLSSVEEIKGDVHIFNSSSATDINLNQLGKISGSLSIDALTQLHVIDFTKLSQIEDLSLISLPSLSTINLNTGISKLGNLKVSDTALSDLSGLIGQITSVNQLDVDNNKNITQLQLNNLQEVTEGLILSFNGDDCEISLNSLQYASNLTLQDTGSISASNLSSVNGSLIIAYNKYDSFELPVEEVGGALQIFANDDLTDFSLGNLTKVGGEVRIFNNSELEDMSESFASLKSIKGAVNIEGSFSNLTMPDLEEVDGDFTVKTDNEDFDCKEFKKLQSSKKIEGHNFKCIAPEKNASVSGSASLATETFDASGSADDDEDEESSSTKSDSGAGYLGSGIVAVFLTTLFSVLI